MIRALPLLLVLVISQRGVSPGTLPQAALQLSPNNGGFGSIHGVVKPPDSPDGIPDVAITLTGATPVPGGPNTQPTVTTDAQGRFSFSNVAPGRYTLRAQRDGYFPANTDPTAPPVIQANSSTAVTIAADGADVQVTILLIPGGTISGLVRDGRGRPATGVPIVVLRTGYQDGRKILTSAALGLPSAARAQVTNDRGEYRLFWFPPGEYYVRTDIQDNRAAPSSTVPLVTFFPGTREVARALPVTVRSGQEVAGIDFALEMAPAFKVSGTVKLLVPGGRTLPDGRISRTISSFYIVDQNAEISDRIPLTSNSVFTANPDQVEFGFELRGIAPGAYYLYPLFSDGQARGGAAGLPSYYSARIPVVVTDRDVTGLTGEIHRFPDVAFHFRMKDPATNVPQQALVPRFQLRIQEAMGSLIAGGPAATPPVNSDGSVVFTNLFPAKYKILVPVVPPGYYVSDIRDGATSLFNDAIVTVTGETQNSPVEIALSTGGGQIRGSVRNKKGEPVAGRVVLVPQSPRRSNSLLYKRVVAPATGQFAFSAIAPGDYKVFAWENLLNGAEENEEFLQKYETQGKLVTVTAGATISDFQIDLISD
jgi:hypothetical protein